MSHPQGQGRSEAAADVDAEFLRRLEAERCRAISDLDLAALDGLLDEQLTHTHVPGHTEDRQTYLRELPRRPRTTTPGPTTVRLLDDVALMTGTLVNSATGPDGAPRRSEVSALRVWRRCGDSWKLAAFAASGSPGGRP